MLTSRCFRAPHRTFRLAPTIYALQQTRTRHFTAPNQNGNPGTALQHRRKLQTASSQPHVPDADHRELGSKLSIYTNHEWSRGSPLFFPDGAHILLKLQDFLRAQYAIFGFQEVITPTIYKQSLWEQSGHWENYGEDMYEVIGRGASGKKEGAEKGEDEMFGLKPMNCPGHCLLFAAKTRHFNHLPVRYADFSPLHRNEISGALTGLTRLRKFHQDDGHIFCREEQVGYEIQKTLQLIERVYNAFGLGPFSLVLSTRPKEKFVGSIETWDRAESQLEEALRTSGIAWTMNPEDGAFYGPKIDIILQDRNGKAHQTATIQLDFQLPERFALKYTDSSSEAETGVSEQGSSTVKQPVLIHRAVLGSLERFLALLLEHTQGKLPLWISPKQVRILTLRSTPEFEDYAQAIAATIRGYTVATDEEAPVLQPLAIERIAVDIDSRAESLSTKFRNARLEHCRIIATVGPEDLETGQVSVNFTGLRNFHALPDILERLQIPLPSEEKRKWDRVPMTATQLRTIVCSLTAAYM